MPGRGLKQGDFFLLEIGPFQSFHVVARYGCGAAVLLGAQPGVLTMDVNILGQHLPQMYRPEECVPLDDSELEYHGLCVGCKGWGITSMFDHADIDQILEGRHGDVCEVCGGSGRRGVTVTVTRTPEETQARIDHIANLADGIDCPKCRAAVTVEVKP